MHITVQSCFTRELIVKESDIFVQTATKSSRLQTPDTYYKLLSYGNRPPLTLTNSTKNCFWAVNMLDVEQ